MIAVVDYGMGNLYSVSQALEELGCEVVVSDNLAVLRQAEGVLLPGVGAFGDAMAELKRRCLVSGLRELAAAGKPFLGICLGMQLLFERSEEHGQHQGLGILPGEVVRFRGNFKIPHMGWNSLRFVREDAIFAGLDEGYAYFVHSYYARPARSEHLLATTDYYGDIAAVVGQGRLYGMQFHPEKSSSFGMGLLRNFVRMCERGEGT